MVTRLHRFALLGFGALATLFLLRRSFSGFDGQPSSPSPINSRLSFFSGSSPDPLLTEFFPSAGPPFQHVLIAEGNKALQALMACLARGTCTENQKKVIIIHSWHFFGWVDGSTTGEAIWCGSMHEALKDLGYTIVFTRNAEESARLYSLFPSLVKVVLGEAPQTGDCYKDETCVKTPRNPLGIPIWKMFSFNIWIGAAHPLGANWTLAIEPLGANQYIGYSLDPLCTPRPFVPHSARKHRAFVLGKRLSYYGYQSSTIGPEAFYAAAKPPLSLGFAGGYGNDTGTNDIKAPSVVDNIGFMTKEQFFSEVAQSKVMIGLGQPLISPSPYDGLCVGVPFLNPIKGWDRADPENRARWWTQNDGLRGIYPPYVYHYHLNDTEAFLDALQQAVKNPIERYTAPWMTLPEVKKRIARLVDYDWRSVAEALLEKRKLEGGELFTI